MNILSENVAILYLPIPHPPSPAPLHRHSLSPWSPRKRHPTYDQKQNSDRPPLYACENNYLS